MRSSDPDMIFALAVFFAIGVLTQFSRRMLRRWGPLRVSLGVALAGLMGALI